MFQVLFPNVPFLSRHCSPSHFLLEYVEYGTTDSEIVTAKELASHRFRVVSFDTTPRMSTYLLTWAFGDFEYVEAFTKRKYKGKKLPVRVYTTRGLKSQAQYALDHAPQIIDYYSEIFGIDYPLPKSDLLAVHEFVSRPT